MVKEALISLIYYRCAPYSKCVQEGNGPKAIKINKVLPLHKNSKTDNVDNFRSIAIVPIIGRIFEMILKDSLISGEK